MLLRKKPMFGANIQPACTYCEFGQKAADPRMILCFRAEYFIWYKKQNTHARPGP